MIPSQIILDRVRLFSISIPIKNLNICNIFISIIIYIFAVRLQPHDQTRRCQHQTLNQPCT